MVKEIAMDNSFVTKMQFWCQRVLPAVYDDSLSYYELLCKVVEYLNKAIEAVNNNATVVDALKKYYMALKEYVDHYFDTLDLGDEVNDILKKWLDDGTLEGLLNQPKMLYCAARGIFDIQGENGISVQNMCEFTIGDNAYQCVICETDKSEYAAILFGENVIGHVKMPDSSHGCVLTPEGTKIYAMVGWDEYIIDVSVPTTPTITYVKNFTDIGLSSVAFDPSTGGLIGFKETTGAYDFYRISSENTVQDKLFSVLKIEGMQFQSFNLCGDKIVVCTNNPKLITVYGFSGSILQSYQVPDYCGYLVIPELESAVVTDKGLKFSYNHRYGSSKTYLIPAVIGYESGNHGVPFPIISSEIQLLTVDWDNGSLLYGNGGTFIPNKPFKVLEDAISVCDILHLTSKVKLLSNYPKEARIQGHNLELRANGKWFQSLYFENGVLNITQWDNSHAGNFEYKCADDITRPCSLVCIGSSVFIDTVKDNTPDTVAGYFSSCNVMASSNLTNLIASNSNITAYSIINGLLSTCMNVSSTVDVNTRLNSSTYGTVQSRYIKCDKQDDGSYTKTIGRIFFTRSLLVYCIVRGRGYYIECHLPINRSINAARVGYFYTKAGEIEIKGRVTITYPTDTLTNSTIVTIDELSGNISELGVFFIS